jgi:hypothetical protein
MPQGGIKLSKKISAQKCPIDEKRLAFFFEKSLKDTAFILSESP